MTTDTLVILDYDSETVHIYKCDVNANIDDDYIKRMGFNPDSTIRMFGSFIDIVKHKGILK